MDSGKRARMESCALLANSAQAGSAAVLRSRWRSVLQRADINLCTSPNKALSSQLSFPGARDPPAQRKDCLEFYRANQQAVLREASTCRANVAEEAGALK